ncbi:hypothetical protein OB955_14305 [Halobacteria archaeon AArc-m2/3/4]|uniref:Uncharacterized protein n=1 Tax=Natronoglomus mannanivorans TaxID=2979990 RepID=A0ABT2QG49_9EURY|nr:hypothetical protein [Halobacteria archaeon AArc-m2/3/4]
MAVIRFVVGARAGRGLSRTGSACCSGRVLAFELELVLAPTCALVLEFELEFEVARQLSAFGR